MNRKQVLMGALLVPVTLSVATNAAEAQEKSKPYGVHLGVASLTGSDERDAFGETGKLGLSYDFQLKGAQKIQPRVDVDYARFSDNGFRLSTLGLSANAEIPLTKNPVRGPYALVGLGIYHVSVDTPGFFVPTLPTPIPTVPTVPTIPTTPGGSGGSGGGSGGEAVLTLGSQAIVAAGLNDSSTKLGVNLGVGYKFSDSLSGELTYRLLGRVAGVRADNVALSLGFSF